MNLPVSQTSVVFTFRSTLVFFQDIPCLWKSFIHNTFSKQLLFSKKVRLRSPDTYSVYSDEELLSLLMNDDDKAFEFIYRIYAKDLFNYARKNISIKEECEEIIHDIFLDIWKRRYQLQHVKSIEAYLFTCVKFKIIRYINHSKVKAKYAEHFKAFELLYDSPSIDKSESEPLLVRLLEAIKGLPLRCQEALKLRLLENLSNDDIALRMNISKRTVEVYMGKAYSYLSTMPDLMCE